MTKIPAVAYYRMSSDQQEASIPEQRVEVEKYAKANGYRIIREYRDEGISGDSTDKRKAFQAMHKAACNGRDFDVVLCWDQDRFGRFDSVEAGYWIHPLRVAGVRLVTVTEGPIDWDGFAGRMLYSIKQEGKHQFLRDLARNTGRGMKARRMAGKWIGQAPLGYEIGGDGKLTPGDPGEIETVRTIFAMRARGLGYFAIAKHLNDVGVPTPRRKAWSLNAVRHVLQREAYLGTNVVGKWSRAKYQRMTESPVEIEDCHPALIERELWEAVRRVQEGNAERRAYWKGDGNGGGALAGLLFCGCCGSPMYHARYIDRPHLSHYVCSLNQRHGGCGFCYVNADAMRRLVAAKIRDKVLLGSLDRLEAAIERQLAKRAAPPDTAPVRRQIEALDRKIENAAGRMLAVDPSLVRDLERALLDLKRQRATLAAQLAIEPKPIDRDPKAIAAALWRLDGLLAAGNPARVREALGGIVARIDIDFQELPGGGKKRRFRPEKGQIEFVKDLPIGSVPSVFPKHPVRITRADFAAA